MNIRSILHRKEGAVPTAKPSDTVQQIMDRLELDEISALIVTDSGHRILGIVSGGDLLRAINKNGFGILTAPVSDVMTTDVFTCDIDAPVSDVYQVMDANRIRHVPIVERDEVRGVINTLDVVKHRLWELELEANALKEYVSGRA